MNRIESAKSLNYLQLTSLAERFDPEANAILVCGPNGAGKTSLIRGIRFALTGDLPQGIHYKKDVPTLITDGEKKGFFSIDVSDGVRSTEYTINLANGNHAGNTPPPIGNALYSLDPQSFMKIEPAKRRAAIFGMAGISLRPADIAADLTKRGHSEDAVKKLAPGINGGFASAQKLADQLASEARGGWQNVTGERYGAVKAKGWTADAPERVDVAPFEAQLADAARTHRTAANLLTQLRADENAHLQAASKQEEAGKVGDLELDVAQIDRKIEASKERLAELTQAASGTKNGWTAPCPCCDAMLFSSGVGVLEAVGTQHGTAPAVAKAGVEAERGVLSQLQAERTTVQRKLDGARAAKLFLGQLPERPTPDDLRQAEAAVTEALADQDVAQGEVNVAQDQNQKAAQAATVTKKAAAYHLEAEAMAKLSAVLEQLPGEYIKAAMDPINAKLADASRVMGFQRVVSIGSDMELHWGSYPYSTCSESQQWRMELVLGLAFSDNNVVLMDRFDCVQPQDRGAILTALGAQTGAQVILGATLKAEPGAVPPGVSAHWLG